VILSKTDLVDARQRSAVEALVREEIPASVKIVAAQHGAIDLDILLGLNSASEDTIHLRPDHHGEEEDHDHDEFDSVSVQLPVVDQQLLLAALQRLVEEHTIYRVKGFVALREKPMRMVLHGVGRRFDSYFDHRWRADETPCTRLVLIGQQLDQDTLQRALQAAALPS
jgi:cobalamin biosynthesis protein CobW